MIFRILLYAFLFYLLYRMIFDFIIPVYKTSNRLKKGFRDAHQKMSEQMNNSKQYSTNLPKSSAPSKASKYDYIEFEEIK